MCLKNLKNYFNKIFFGFIVAACMFFTTGRLEASKNTIACKFRVHHKKAAHFKGYIERAFLKSGLVDVQTLSNRFFIQLDYSDTSNFLHKDVYGNLNKCYLNKETAEKLLIADSLLQLENKNYHFLLFDGARPLSIQKLMYDLYRKMPVAQGLYLSHPDHYSLHNYGAAIDLTICDENGKPIDMGTKFDHFGIESHITDEYGLMKSGKITEQAYNNRRMVRRVMQKAKFTPILFEWWHFNSCSRGYAAAHYTLVK